MDAQELKKEISIQSQYLKGLGLDLQELKYDLEFCSGTNDIYNNLQKVAKLTVEINGIIEGMSAIKHMAEIQNNNINQIRKKECQRWQLY